MEVRELGAGRGLFAQDVLDWSIRKFPEFFRALHYSLVESSPSLRQKIQSTLVRHFESGKASLEGERRRSSPGSSNAEIEMGKGTTSVVPQSFDDRATSAAVVSVSLILFANEFFDAFPVEIVSDQGSLRIASEDGQLKEIWAPSSEAELEFLDRYGVHPEPGERIEVPLAAQRYMNQLAASARKAVFVIIDYGYTRQEQLSGLHRGTLMTFRQHSAADDPYDAPGERDITTHANFTALAAAAEQNGMHVEPLVTQSQLLLGIGESTQFADVFEDTRLPQERAKRALQLKHLINPEGMGETFRVLVASKGVTGVDSLSGLSFGK